MTVIPPPRPHAVFAYLLLLPRVVHELLHVTFLQKLLDDLQLRQLLRLGQQFGLLLHDEGEPVFEGVFGPALELADHFGPPFLALVFLDDGEQQQILLFCPGSLFEVRVEVAVPVFPALFSATVDFVGIGVHEVEFLGDDAPILIAIFS